MTAEDSMIYQSNNKNEVLLECKSPYSEYLGLFEDNGKVAYGYLIKNSKIISDVWIYNRIITPAQPEWKDPSLFPFANSKQFASEIDFSLPVHSKDILFVWNHNEDSQLIDLRISIREEIYALLEPSSRVGWSKLAFRNGPLAKVLSHRINVNSK